MHGEPDWSLTDAQYDWFKARDPEVKARTWNDMGDVLDYLYELSQRPDFAAVFGSMGFDEAFDRYEVALDYERDGLTEEERASVALDGDTHCCTHATTNPDGVCDACRGDAPS